METQKMIEQKNKPIEEALYSLSAEGVFANYSYIKCLWR